MFRVSVEACFNLKPKLFFWYVFFVDLDMFVCGEYVALLSILGQWVFENISCSYSEVMIHAKWYI